MIGKIKNKFLGWVQKHYNLEAKFDWKAYTGNPFARYDQQTAYIIKKVLKKDSNTIDIGAHMGEILDELITAAPGGKHFAFEPLPHLHERLKFWYSKKVEVYPYALSDEDGNATFNYVVSNPYYSGLLKQKYPGEEKIELLEVEVKRLDNVIPSELPIHFIKIDVEGAEFNVLKGAENLLRQWKPVIVYEQGLGSAEFYGTTPEAFYDYMSGLGYKLSLMDYYIANLQPLTREEYALQFYKRYNYYFIAY